MGRRGFTGLVGSLMANLDMTGANSMVDCTEMSIAANPPYLGPVKTCQLTRTLTYNILYGDRCKLINALAQMGPFHILLDEMGLDQMGLDKVGRPNLSCLRFMLTWNNASFVTYYGPLLSTSEASSAIQQKNEKFCKTQLIRHLTNLNERKATGADGISAKLLRMAAPGIATSLTKLFNYSLKTGQISRDWKVAHVTPVPKKGVKELAENYRPVSVLPIVAKVFEAIVYNQLFVYLQDNFLLHSAQSGFRPLHNTQHVLLRSVDDWQAALDRDEIVGTILIDLSKAFDSIDHKLVGSQTGGIWCTLSNEKEWFLSYLTDRPHRVVVHGWSKVDME